MLSCEVSCQSSREEPSDLGKESAPALPQMRNEILPFDSVCDRVGLERKFRTVQLYK